MRGALIVFEGPDGAGKTTLVGRYAEWRRQRGDAVTTLAFPGREPQSLGRLVYKIHHDPVQFDVASMTPESLQALHVAAHLDAIDRYIRPAITRGETVILDRFWWSTWVYGLDSDADPLTLEALVECERTHWGDLRPDVVVLITRQDSLRAGDGGALWARRLELYEGLAERERRHYPVRVVRNDTSEADTLERLVDAIRQSQEDRIAMPLHKGNAQR